ncbi:MAG: TRAP transporter large permease [Ectothiorhodospiraceae bacterium]|nr:TRAP transporter large permease [Ectothiorhodospiraceae bacterium]
MDNVTIGAVATLLGLVLIALRIQIGVALGLVSFFGIAAILNMKAAWGIVTAVPFNFVGDWNLTAVPMFLLMGYIAFSANLTSGLFRAMRVVLSRLPGGLAVASVMACAMLAAASGSSVATSSAMARIATPEMLRYRYDAGLSSGVIAAAGTLGSLIPPSILMVLYGYFAEVSIARLFVAGFLPGLLSAIMFSAMIIIRVRISPELAPPVTETFSREEKLAAMRDIWPMPVLIVIVLAGIFIGLFTPTEAGAVGAALSLLLAAARRTLSIKVLREACLSTIIGTAGIFMVVIGTVLLGKLMALSGLPNALTGMLLEFGGDRYSVILMVVVLYLVLGMFLDSIGILLLTLPILLPITEAVGIDLIWFGIVLIKLLEIGLVTPPVGLNVYVMKGALGNLVSLPTIFRGVTWFIITDTVTLTIIVLFPMLSLYLPSLMEF